MARFPGSNESGFGPIFVTVGGGRTTHQGAIWTLTSANGTSFNYTLLGSGNSNYNDPTVAYAINRDGLAVGQGSSGGQGYVWVPSTVNGTSGTQYSLGLLSTGDTSIAYAINNPALSGGTYTATIVGTDTPSSGTSKAVEWTVNYSISGNSITVNSVSSSPTDLNTLGTFTGWTLEQANGVNASGYIVGTGTYSGTSGTQGFLFY